MIHSPSFFNHTGTNISKAPKNLPEAECQNIKELPKRNIFYSFINGTSLNKRKNKKKLQARSIYFFYSLLGSSLNKSDSKTERKVGKKKKKRVLIIGDHDIKKRRGRRQKMASI